MLLLPTTMLEPSAAGGLDGPEADRESIPRGVPLRQRQLPASFWQEPNRAWPPPAVSTYGPMHPVVPDPAAAGQRVPTDYGVPWPSMPTMPGAAPTDYGYGPPTASVLPSLPCSCPHCTEKHYRAAAQMAAYPWSSVPDNDVKSRVDGWVWTSPASAPKGSQAPPPPVMPPFQNPYGVPVSVGTSVGMDVGDAYAAAAGHQGAFWKANANGTVSSTGYWPMPYSFN